MFDLYKGRRILIDLGGPPVQPASYSSVTAQYGDVPQTIRVPAAVAGDSLCADVDEKWAFSPLQMRVQRVPTHGAGLWRRSSAVPPSGAAGVHQQLSGSVDGHGAIHERLSAC
jgi:hypothetical protein